MQRARLTRNASRVLGNTFPFVIGSALVAVVGCTTVGDTPSGLQLDRAAPTTCIQACNEQYGLLTHQELKLREVNVEACHVSSQPERGTCLEAESLRHAAEMLRLEQAKVDCINSCSHQGASTAVAPGDQ